MPHALLLAVVRFANPVAPGCGILEAIRGVATIEGWPLDIKPDLTP